MGTGFWLIQAAFVLAAIATAIQVERERNRPDPVGGGRRVRIELGTAFTIQEHARLLSLRHRIREAKFGGGRLSDDLVPAPDGSPSSEPDGAPVREFPIARLLLVAGLVLLLVGGVGMWQANTAMSASGSSWFTRFVPGPIANPARYLGAVNSSSAQSVGVDALAQLNAKQAMDRWEALASAGLALLMAGIIARPEPSEAEPRGTLVNDLLGVFVLLTLLFGGLSFFELP